MECEKTCSGYIQTNPTKPTNDINVKEDYAKEEYNACHERPVAGPCRSACQFRMKKNAKRFF